MNFYKILKIKKLGRGSPDFWSRLFAKHTGGGSIKPTIVELTGKLPLTFITSDTKLHDWTIYGNNEPGKNFVRVTVSMTLTGITFTVDPDAGTVTANGTSTGNSQFKVAINNPVEPNNITVPPGNYYFSGCPSGGDYDSYNCYSWDYSTRARSKQWNGTTAVETDLGQGNCQVQINGHPQGIVLRIQTDYTANNVVFKPMLRRADTSEDFEPYQIGVGEFNVPQVYTDWERGTRVPTAQGGETYEQIKANAYNRVRCDNLIPVVTPFYYEINSGYQIGATFFDENGLSLGSSSNVAFRSAPYTYTGVGKYVSFVIKKNANTAITPSDDFEVKIASPYGYQIPLDVRDGKTDEDIYTSNIFIGDSPLTEGESVSKSSTGIDIQTIADGGSYPNILTTALTNKPEMTIKYKTKGGN